MGWFSKNILNCKKAKAAKAEKNNSDPCEQNTGIHLLSNYGERYELISPEANSSIAIELINSLDWASGFYQVIYTREPDVLLEVGGSLNKQDGLSGVYINRVKNIETVTTRPPATTAEMVEIVESFAKGTNVWQTKYTWG